MPSARRRPARNAAGTTVSVTTTMTTMNGVPVQVGGVNIGRPKSATTDAQGMFEFTGLPAGTYRLKASAGQYSAAYLGIAYGGKKPAGIGPDLGTPIPLADGQTFSNAVIALPRGSVITGRFTHEMGEPLSRVQVYTIFFRRRHARPAHRQRRPTDDLGQFRLFGLARAITRRRRSARQHGVPPNAPPETEETR